jgi:hypothetical protein
MQASNTVLPPEIENTIQVVRGETLSSLAARVFPNQDVTRFIEILDLNPELNVFDEITEGMSINIPSTDQIFGYADPIFEGIANATQKATGILGDVTEQIQSFSGKLPPELQGYAAEALEVIGEVNGFLGDVETKIEGVSDQLREYKGKATNLVNWLLSGNP